MWLLAGLILINSLLKDINCGKVLFQNRVQTCAFRAMKQTLRTLRRFAPEFSFHKRIPLRAKDGSYPAKPWQFLLIVWKIEIRETLFGQFQDLYHQERVFLISIETGNYPWGMLFLFKKIGLFAIPFEFPVIITLV